MRGKDVGDDDILPEVGITPAHAGKRKAGAERWQAVGDHPRACGEKTQEVTKYKAYDILHA